MLESRDEEPQPHACWPATPIGAEAAGRQALGLGEGLVGQCALEKKTLLLNYVPAAYIRITSGLGEAPPRSIVVLPVLFEGQIKARASNWPRSTRFNPTHHGVPRAT